MAYKKYIKRGGKLYGPYIYHSKRVDGKVISEYHGSKKFNYRVFLFALAGVLIVSLFVLAFFSSERGITGNAILDLNADYHEGESLNGKITVSLQEGELVPSSSMLVFENNGNTFEYNLKDLVNEETVNGDFYVEGSSFSGSGEGYGVVGEKISYPEVHFILSLLSEEKQEVAVLEEIVEDEIPTESIVDEPLGEVTEETSEEIVEEVVEENIQEPEQIETIEETIEEPVEEPEETVAENIVSGLAEGISNFFLSLEITGNAVIEFESEVEGSVSFGNVFTYNLNDGQRVEIRPRSVMANSKQLPDDAVEMIIQNNEISITTNYFETEEGFGQEYIGSEINEINVDVSNLNLVFEPGLLKLSIVDGGVKIVSLETTLNEGVVEAETPPRETETFAQEPSIVQQNTTGNVSGEFLEIQEILELTKQERDTLENEFGKDFKVSQSAKTKKDFLIVRLELNELWIEHSYSSDLSNSTLQSFMEEDRIKWLKDIAKSFSDYEEPEKEIEEFEGNYSV